MVYHSALPVGIKCRYKIRAPTLSHNCQVISVFSFANSHAYLHTHTHTRTHLGRNAAGHLCQYILGLAKSLTRAQLESQTRGPSITCINSASKDTHTGSTRTHMHTHKHAQACTVTDSRTYSLKVCYKYAHYVRAKWQQRLLHTHTQTHRDTFTEAHRLTHTTTMAQFIIAYFVAIFQLISIFPPLAFAISLPLSAFEVAFHCIISLCIAN